LTTSAQHLGRQLLNLATDGLLFMTQLCSFNSRPCLHETLSQWLETLPDSHRIDAQRLCGELSQTPVGSSLSITWPHEHALPDLSPFFKNIETLDFMTWSTNAPEWLGHFPKLRKLNILAEFWTELPNNLQNLSCLEEIKLRKCQRLTHLSDSILNLKKLRELSINQCQILRHLPENLGQLTNLTKLSIHRCRSLARLPGTLNQIRNLRKLNATHCPQLTSLPENILELPSACTLNLESSGLSPRVLSALQERIDTLQQQNIPVPRIYYSLDSEENTNPEDIGSLQNQIEAWRKEGELHHPLHQAEEDAINNLPTSESQALAILLHRLRKTAIYSHQPQATIERVNQLLSQALKSPDMLGVYCAMALESTETCDDRTALGLLHMERIALEHDLLEQAKQAPSPQQAYALLKEHAPGFFKLNKILDIAHAHASTARGMVDETEIVLRYLTALGEEFNLPTRIDYMKFPEHGWQVTPQALENARKQLNNQSNNSIVHLWSQWPVYRDTVEHQEPTVYQHLQEKQNRTSEAFATRLQPLTTALEQAIQQGGIYSEEAININIDINNLAKEQDQAITKPWKQHVANSLKYQLDE
jgi:hypothetical protein